MARLKLFAELGLPGSTTVVGFPVPEPDGSWECLLSLGPRGPEEPDSDGVAVYVLRPKGGACDAFALEAPKLCWRQAGVGARASVALERNGFFKNVLGQDEITGTVVERGPGTLRRILLDPDALTRNEALWPLQELPEAAEGSLVGTRWCSRQSRCALQVKASQVTLWQLGTPSGSLETMLPCQCDAQRLTAQLEDLKLSLSLSSDGLSLTGTLNGKETSFRRLSSEDYFVWGSQVSEYKEPSSLKRVEVEYRRQGDASAELQLELQAQWPFTPIVVSGFKAEGAAQAAKVRAGWYLDIKETFFGGKSRLFKELLEDKGMANIQEAYRRIHELYELLLQCLERSAVCLVFCNGYEAQLLPEARVTISEGLEVRDALGELEGGLTVTGRALKHSHPVFEAGVRAGWHLDVARTQHLGATEKEAEALIDGKERRLLCFRWAEQQEEIGFESDEVLWSHSWSGADSVVVRASSQEDAATADGFLVAVPTGEGHVVPTEETLQRLAAGWEESSDRFFGLRGEEVSAERDSWDEARLRALCAQHGWEFAWMTEDDERRRRFEEDPRSQRAP